MSEMFISHTDWQRLNSMSEEEIMANALADADNPPLNAESLAQLIPLENMPGRFPLEKIQAAKKLLKGFASEKSAIAPCAKVVKKHTVI